MDPQGLPRAKYVVGGIPDAALRRSVLIRKVPFLNHQTKYSSSYIMSGVIGPLAHLELNIRTDITKWFGCLQGLLGGNVPDIMRKLFPEE